MNIEKIKNYNQKLFAVLGTILVVLAAISLVMMSYFFIIEISREIRWKNENDGILSEEKIEKLQKENKRQQIISYDLPKLIDTLNSIYIIPVSHKTLNSAEYIDDGVLGITDSDFISKSSDRGYSRSYYGSFNNLLIHSIKDKSIKVLFNERVNFNQLRTEKVDDEYLVFISASNNDTYRDGIINLKDLKSLYIYSLKDKKLRKISEENMDVQDYNFIPDQKDLLIRFGIDHNKNGTFNEGNEPYVIKRYDFANDRLVDLLDNQTHNNLQHLVEGSVK